MSMPEIVFGTCDGTGAAINVCLGFIPRYVKVWNMEDAGSKLPILEWNKQMSLISAMDEGTKLIGLDDTDMDRSVVASAGISAYAGGDKIKFDKTSSNRWELTTGTAFPGGNSAEEVYVDGSYERTATTDAAYKCYGNVVNPNPGHGAEVTTAPGFTIGADSDVNADGEQISWMAIR